MQVLNRQTNPAPTHARLQVKQTRRSSVWQRCDAVVSGPTCNISGVSCSPTCNWGWSFYRLLFIPALHLFLRQPQHFTPTLRHRGSHIQLHPQNFTMSASHNYRLHSRHRRYQHERGGQRAGQLALRVARKYVDAGSIRANSNRFPPSSTACIDLLHLTHVVLQNVTQKIQTSPAVAASSSGCTSHFKVKTDVTLAGTSRSRIMRLLICASEHRVLTIRSRITFSLFLLQRTIHPAACGPN